MMSGFYDATQNGGKKNRILICLLRIILNINLVMVDSIVLRCMDQIGEDEIIIRYPGL